MLRKNGSYVNVLKQEIEIEKINKVINATPDPMQAFNEDSSGQLSFLERTSELIQEAHKKADYIFEETKKKIKAQTEQLKATRLDTKKFADYSAYFSRAAKPLLDAEKLLTQQENYSHFDEINALYSDAKYRNDKAIEKARIERERKMAAETG